MNASIEIADAAVGVFCGDAVGVFCGVGAGEGVCVGDDCGVWLREGCGVSLSDSDGGTNTGKLGIGRAAGVSLGISGAAVMVGNVAGADCLVEVRGARPPCGVIGRTASKY